MECLTDNKKKGFSLLELVLAIALGLIIIAALVSTFVAQRSTYDAQEQGSEMTQTARAALDMIGREIVMGGYDPDPNSTLQRDDPTQDTFTGVYCNGGQLEIRADLDGDAFITDGTAYDDNEVIIYQLTGDVLQRKVGGGAFQNFAENIDTFSFDCRDADGNTTANTEDVRQVQVSITTTTEKASAGTAEDTIDMTAVFKVRNMGLSDLAGTGGGGGGSTTTVPGTTTTTVATTTTTVVGPTTTTTTSTTLTSTSTTTSTTTTSYYIPEELDELVAECYDTYVGVSVEQCAKTYNDYLLLRVYVGDETGSPIGDIPLGDLRWYVNGALQTDSLEPSSTQPGWYGSSGLCNCGTFINTFSCAVSDEKQKEFTITVEYDVNSVCTLSYTTDELSTR